jgi:hypothetical protein
MAYRLVSWMEGLSKGVGRDRNNEGILSLLSRIFFRLLDQVFYYKKTA